MSTQRKMGAPSKYNKEFDQMLIDHMEKGYSFKSFSAVAGVCEDTLFEWVKTEESFAEAKETAFAKCLLYCEKLGIDNIINTSESFGNNQGSTSKSLNGSVWIFNMKNRFKWRDKQVDEIDTQVVNEVKPAEVDYEKLMQMIEKAKGS
jgi:hypothetical protein